MSTNGTTAARPFVEAEANGTSHEKVVQTMEHHPAQDTSDQPKNGAEEKQQAPKRHSTLDIKHKFNKEKEKIISKAKPPGGFDPTPIPDAPPGYTIKFTFHRASNLPAADIGTQASDPFIEATLTTSLPKRHKEDPDLVHRTRTIRRTTEPNWQEDWIVANVPALGFKLKCRLYDEDWPDHNDRLGNVTIVVPSIGENWEGIKCKEYNVKKRMGSKRAYLVKAITSGLNKNVSMTPKLYVSAALVGKSDPPHGHIYTVGPCSYFRHFSPMIGRIAGVQVTKDQEQDSQGAPETHDTQDDDKKNKKTQKYDFQAVEIQLQGPVPPRLYHRYVEFRPLIGLMFSRSGIRGRVMHKALTHQHNRIYNFDSSTEWEQFEPCSEEASMQFLKLAHYDQGSRIFTYVITLDGLFRFTETGKEFGIDLLSKHTMHSDVATYIACSGEFFIRRLKKPNADESPEPNQPTHPNDDLSGGPPHHSPPTNPQYYQLIIDNDSGTYRPEKSVLPDLKMFLENNFPGLGIVTLGCDDEEDKKLKEEQREAKKKEGLNVHLVPNRSLSSSSVSSSDMSDLDDMERAGDAGHKSKKERMWDLLEKEEPLKDLKQEFSKRHHHHLNEGGPSGKK